MRFNDMLATVMAQPQSDAVARQIMWRQLVDIVAQKRGHEPPEDYAYALEWLESARREIAPSVRASAAQSIAPRVNSMELVGYFAKDDPAIAAPILRQAKLSGDQWCALLPSLPPTSRALLRGRRDLPEGVDVALRSFGSADFALNAPTSNNTAHAELSGTTPIAEIVARIEAFRAQKSAMPAHVDADTGHSFDFETDAEGDITHVSGVPREAICGMSLASPSDGWLDGVDGHAVGAFRGRTAFAGARLGVAGHGPASGDWVIDGEPMFEAQDGKFLGYRGHARRPLPHERAQLESQSSNGDGLRQLVHELRTPLNAVCGFAEMIEQQMLGPVAETYRVRARNILHEGHRLLAAIEDVDFSARPDASMRGHTTGHAADISALVTVVARELEPVSDRQQVHLHVIRPANEMLVAADGAALRQILSKLLGYMIGVAQVGETLSLVLDRVDGGHVRCVLGRPRVLLGLSERELHQPNYGPEGEWPDAPLLGIGFGLRLIEKLARAANVKFSIGDNDFSLIIAAAHDSGEAHNRMSQAHGEERLSTRPPTAD